MNYRKRFVHTPINSDSFVSSQIARTAVRTISSVQSTNESSSFAPRLRRFSSLAHPSGLHLKSICVSRQKTEYEGEVISCKHPPYRRTPSSTHRPAAVRDAVRVLGHDDVHELLARKERQLCVRLVRRDVECDAQAPQHRDELADHVVRDRDRLRERRVAPTLVAVVELAQGFGLPHLPRPARIEQVRTLDTRVLHTLSSYSLPHSYILANAPVSRRVELGFRGQRRAVEDEDRRHVVLLQQLDLLHAVVQIPARIKTGMSAK